MAILALDLSSFFTRFSDAKFSRQKLWGDWFDTLLPNSGIFNHYWEMASWNNINVLRFGPDFSIFDNSHVHWHTRLGDFSIRLPGCPSCPIFTLLSSAARSGNM